MSFCVLLGSLASPIQAAKTLRPLETKQRYQQVLKTLATGDLEQALDELQAMEKKAVGEDQPWRMVDNLWKLKLQVIRDLLASQPPELLMPIIVLHHDAYFRYAEQDRPYLAQHSRTMAAELAQVLAERAGTPAAAAFSGWTLSSFGAYLWSPSSIGASADLFYRAFLVDPGNPVALRGLAAAHERAGEYEKASEYLMKALALERGDPELMLRLALCGWRRDAATVDTAISTLSSLTAAGNPDWIRSVAYQEMARAHLSKGESEAAEAVLRQGLQELPGDQQMSLQLAAILDGQRRRDEVLAVLDAIEIVGWERDSPRQIYDFWTPADMESVRTDLHQEMQQGLVALATGLAAPTTAPSGS